MTLGLPQLDDRAEKILTKTISAYGKLEKDVDIKRWKSMRAKRGVQLFSGLHQVGHTPVLCVGTLHARFDDVLEGLYCDNTENMLLTNAIKCPRLANSAVLSVVQKRTQLEPYAFTGIKCLTIKFTANNRDLCYFDKMGMVCRTKGRRMAYHIMQSVDLPVSPSKMTHQRAQMFLCYVFEELEDDLVGVYMNGNIDVGTWSYFLARAVSDVLLAFTNALECTRANKFALMMTIAHFDAVPCNSSRTKCNVCNCSSSRFSTFLECAGCHEPVCKSCRFRETVLNHSKRADFCRQCFATMNLVSTKQLRIRARAFNTPVPSNSERDAKQSENNSDNFERSLQSFNLNITTQAHFPSSDWENRVSNLYSTGWASSSDEDGEDVDIDLESEGRDVLKSSRLMSTPVIDEKTRARSRRSSTTSTASSIAHDEEVLDKHQTTIMAKLQMMSLQIEKTLMFTQEQSAVARSVRERSRGNRLLQKRSYSSSSHLS